MSKVDERQSKEAQSILEVNHVSAGYRKAQVLYDVSLVADEGKITGLMGPNGSGKSTVLKTIFGLTDLYGGSIVYSGKNIEGLRPHEVARSGIAYLPQVNNVYSGLLVEENLRMAGYAVQKQDLDARIKEVLEVFPNLKRYLKSKGLVLSGGERQMLAMASALLRKPALMMLDEPATNLSPKLVELVYDKIKELNSSLGMTIFIVEQHVQKLVDVCERIYCLVAGRMKFSCMASEFAKSERKFELFLGVEEIG